MHKNWFWRVLISLSYQNVFLLCLRNKTKVNAILLFSRFRSIKLFLNFIWLSVDSYSCLCHIVPFLCLYFLVMQCRRLMSSHRVQPWPHFCCLVTVCSALILLVDAVECVPASSYPPVLWLSRFLSQNLIICWCCIHASIVFIFSIFEELCLSSWLGAFAATHKCFPPKQFPS